MSEVKIMNFLLSSLLIMSVVLFTWTCSLIKDTTTSKPVQTTAAAFSG